LVAGGNRPLKIINYILNSKGNKMNKPEGNNQTTRQQVNGRPTKDIDMPELFNQIRGEGNNQTTRQQVPNLIPYLLDANGRPTKDIDMPELFNQINGVANYLPAGLQISFAQSFIKQALNTLEHFDNPLEPELRKIAGDIRTFRATWKNAATARQNVKDVKDGTAGAEIAALQAAINKLQAAQQAVNGSGNAVDMAVAQNTNIDAVQKMITEQIAKALL
jgi:hypothetical protein